MKYPQSALTESSGPDSRQPRQPIIRCPGCARLAGLAKPHFLVDRLNWPDVGRRCGRYQTGCRRLNLSRMDFRAGIAKESTATASKTRVSGLL